MSLTTHDYTLTRTSTDNVYEDEDEAQEFELLVQAYLRDSYYTTSNQAAFNLVYGINL